MSEEPISSEPGSVPERSAGSVPERSAGSVPERSAALEALRTELTHALLEAGFAIHHAHLPSGGVRLVVDRGGPDGDGILVSWAAAVTLDSDERRRPAYNIVLATMNRAMGEVLAALGYQVAARGEYGVPLVTGRKPAAPT